MPKYKKGDVLAVRAVVAQDTEQGAAFITVKRKNRYGEYVNYDVPVEEIFEVKELATPEEPERHLLLKSMQNGQLWSFAGDGWRRIGHSGYGRTWSREFYDANGPFKTFTPDGEV